MSVDAVMVRIAEIQQLLEPKPPAAPAAAAGTPPAPFAGSLQGAMQAASAQAPVPVGAPVGGSVGQRMLQLAEGEVGVTEQPPGSNDGPRIAQYRSATAGGGVGPWCAYFVSWLASQAGAPVGEQGQGFAGVSALYGWAQRTGRAIPAGPGVQPQPGDLIVWGGRHIGLVESVDPDGTIHTIEGNSSNAVSKRTYGPDGGGATGYVRL